MNDIKNYIRQILLENMPDLGKKVFATKAPEGHSQHGDEEDTEFETKLYTALKEYLVQNDITKLIEVQWEIEHLMSEDSPYREIFKYDNRNRYLYRGQVVSKRALMNAAGRDGGRNAQEAIEYYASEGLGEHYEEPEFAYVPEEFHRRSEMSSWSDNEHVAIHFAKGYRRGIPDPVRVVFVALARSNRFLDISPFYEYMGLEEYRKESESLALEPVALEYLYILPPDPEEDD